MRNILKSFFFLFVLFFCSVEKINAGKTREIRSKDSRECARELRAKVFQKARVKGGKSGKKKKSQIFKEKQRTREFVAKKMIRDLWRKMLANVDAYSWVALENDFEMNLSNLKYGLRKVVKEKYEIVVLTNSDAREYVLGVDLNVKINQILQDPHFSEIILQYCKMKMEQVSQKEMSLVIADLEFQNVYSDVIAFLRLAHQKKMCDQFVRTMCFVEEKIRKS